MDDKDIHERFQRLVDEEHTLRERLGRGEITRDEEHARFRELEIALDQSWDLLGNGRPCARPALTRTGRRSAHRARWKATCSSAGITRNNSDRTANPGRSTESSIGGEQPAVQELGQRDVGGGVGG